MEPTLTIMMYNKCLVITLLNRGPKVHPLEKGTKLTDFNSKDLWISQEVLDHFNNIKGKIPKDQPVIECISKDTIWWWSNNKGLIVPKHEIDNILISQIPHHTLKNNVVSDNIITYIKQNNLDLD